MSNGFLLKFLGELFYLIVALGALYGIWGLFRSYRQMHSTVIKTHIIAYEIQKMVEGRSRKCA
jgi:hypothetical protein